MAILKALNPEDWPDRIHVGKAVVRFPNGTESGSWYDRPLVDVDPTSEYIRADLMAELVEALRWYGEVGRLARLITREGDAGRAAISADGGQRAAAALAKIKEPQT